jgi:L-gulonate 5-dehydrogenase
MRAALTIAPRSITLGELPDPPAPGSHEVLVQPEAVGVCGSDLHYFLGELPGQLYPRVQGHELAATIVALGPVCEPRLIVGERVAVWPLRPCGACYPCSIGRVNVCPNFSLIGIHVDGGLQQQLLVPDTQCFPITAPGAPVATLAEPLSIAVHAAARAAIAAGEAVVVLGAGPIGQCVTVVASERGARVLAVDRVERRLELSRALGAEAIVYRDAAQLVADARAWAGGDGPPVVVDATGAPVAVRAALEMVSPAGRVIVVGLSAEDVSLPLGSFAHKELDVLGASCCTAEEFGQAVALVERHAASLERFISDEFPLEHAQQAVERVLEHPAEVMKVVISSQPPARRA